MTFSEKVEQRAAIKFCVDIGKTPKETHGFRKQSGKHCNMGRLLLFKRYRRFLDTRNNFRDDMHEGRSSFREFSAAKYELRDVLDSERRLTVIEIAEKCGISKISVHEILSHDLYMNIRMTPEQVVHIFDH